MLLTIEAWKNLKTGRSGTVRHGRSVNQTARNIGNSAALERLEDRTLLTDLVPPLVVTASAIDNPGGATFSSVRIQFDEAVDPASATNIQNFRLKTADGAFVALSSAAMDVSDASGKSVIVTFTGQLSGTNYEVHVGAVADLAGNALPEFGRNYLVSSAVITSERSMTLGDFDGDGTLDLVTASNNDYEVWFHKGLGNGNFATQTLITNALGVRSEIHVADIDGDGHLDFVMREYRITSPTIGVYFGNGDGTFANAVQVVHAAGSTVDVIDIDSDGDLDIVAGGGPNSANFTVYLNPRNPGGVQPATQEQVRSLATWSTFTAGNSGGAAALEVGDINGDSRLDIVEIRSGSTALRVWLAGTTPGTFLPPILGPTTMSSSHNSLVDLNGDGQLDLFLGVEGTIMFGIADSPYFMAPQMTPFGADGSRSTAWAVDLDGDGDLDLLTGSYPSGATNLNPTISVLYNRGGGSFDSSLTPLNLSSLGIKRVRQVRLADLNGDGLPDIVGIDGSTNRVFVLMSQPATPAATVTFIANQAPVSSAGGPYTISEGDSLALDANGSTDPDGDPLIYTWDLNGDGVFGDATGVAPTLSWSQLVALGIHDDGTRTVTVRATDSRGWSTTNSVSLTTRNTPPTLILSGGSSTTEGSVYTLNLASSDPGADTITSWLINWGDGNTSFVSGNPSSRTHVYADNGVYTITATATDEDGIHAATNSVAVTIDNVAPVVSAGSSGLVDEGTTFTRGGSFSDPGFGDTWTAVVDYGDGTGFQTLALNADKSFTLSRVYTTSGSYTVTVIVTDDDGGVGSASFGVTVNNVAPNITLSGPANGSLNQSVTFTASNSGNPFDTLTYLWTVVRAGTATPILVSTASSLVFSGARGSYTVKLTVTDDEGTTDTKQQSYNVNVTGADSRSDLIGYGSGTWTAGVSTGNASGGALGSFITSIAASWGNITGAPIATGDFNGDGATDVVRLEGSILRVGLSNGGSFGNAVWSDLGAGTWTYLTVGDVNGDGRDDVMVRGPGAWHVILSTGTGFAPRAVWAGWSDINWNDINLVDLNGDGRADLIGRTQGNQWWVALANDEGTAFGPASIWATWSTLVTWESISFADFGGDSKIDLAGRVNNEWFVAISNGTTFTTKKWFGWNSSHTWQDHRVGDFNGDTKSDIAARISAGNWYIALATGEAFVLTATQWGFWTTTANWQDIRVGDFNGDGKADITGRIGGNWRVSISTGTAFTDGNVWGTGWTSTYNFVGVGKFYSGGAAAPVAGAPVAAATVKTSSGSPVASVNRVAVASSAKEESLALFWSSTKDDERFAAALLSV